MRKSSESHRLGTMSRYALAPLLILGTLATTEIGSRILTGGSAFQPTISRARSAFSELLDRRTPIEKIEDAIKDNPELKEMLSSSKGNSRFDNDGKEPTLDLGIADHDDIPGVANDKDTDSQSENIETEKAISILKGEVNKFYEAQIADATNMNALQPYPLLVEFWSKVITELENAGIHIDIPHDMLERIKKAKIIISSAPYQDELRRFGLVRTPEEEKLFRQSEPYSELMRTMKSGDFELCSSALEDYFSQNGYYFSFFHTHAELGESYSFELSKMDSTTHQIPLSRFSEEPEAQGGDAQVVVLTDEVIPDLATYAQSQPGSLSSLLFRNSGIVLATTEHDNRIILYRNRLRASSNNIQISPQTLGDLSVANESGHIIFSRIIPTKFHNRQFTLPGSPEVYSIHQMSEAFSDLTSLKASTKHDDQDAFFCEVRKLQGNKGNPNFKLTHAFFITSFMKCIKNPQFAGIFYDAPQGMTSDAVFEYISSWKNDKESSRVREMVLTEFCEKRFMPIVRHIETSLQAE